MYSPDVLTRGIIAMAQAQQETIDDMFKRLAHEWKLRAANGIKGRWAAYARAAESGRFPVAPCDPSLMMFNAEAVRAMQAGKTIDVGDIPDN
jgi:hypothetical protein